MKVHKLEIYAYEPNNDWDLDDVKIQIENGMGDCLIEFGKCETKDAGEWDDDHPLNSTKTNYDKYFKSLKN